MTPDTSIKNSKITAMIERVKLQGLALYFAYQNPATPWYAKLTAALVVVQIFSPLDLIPDFIPLVGYLDDLVLIPLGIWLAWKFIPTDIRQRSIESAREHLQIHPDIPQIYKIILVVTSMLILGSMIWLVVFIAKGKPK